MPTASEHAASAACASWPARLERHRAQLLTIAARQVRPHWRSKLAASDLVQQTLLEAAVAKPSNEIAEADVLRWLRRIMANNLQDARRQLNAGKRDVGREVSLHKSRLLRAAPAPRDDGPSATVLREEQDERLDRAIASLPPEQQRVIQLRHAEDRASPTSPPCWASARTPRRNSGRERSSRCASA